MNKIIIGDNLDKELTAILGHLCIQIEKEFDICPSLLSHMIGNYQFLEYCQFLYGQCHSEMNNQLIEFKDKFNILTEHGADKIEIYGDRYEKCGYLVKSFRNGHIQYCNLHKYLHPHDNSPCQVDKYMPQINHEFVLKTTEQIIKEHYYISIHTIYKNYMNKLFMLIRQLFNYYLCKDCDIQTCKVDMIGTITKHITENKNMFKSKVLYERIWSDADGKPQTEYYLKLYIYRYMATKPQEQSRI